MGRRKRKIGDADLLDALRRLLQEATVEEVGKRRKTRWKVTARAPRGRDGRNCQLVFSPPPGEGRPGREGRRYQESAGTSDLQEAQDIAAARERQLNGDSLAFADVALRYMEHKALSPKTKPATLRRYSDALGAVGTELGSRQVSKATILRVQERLQLRLAPRTVLAYLWFAGAAWNWAHARGDVDVPWPKLHKEERIDVVDTEKRPTTHEETSAILSSLLSYSGGHYYPLFALIADLGSRLTETCLLRERDLDRENGTVTLTHTKTGRQRTICASPEVLELIPRQDPQAYLFQAKRQPGQPVSRKSAHNAFRRVVIQLGLGEEPIDVHSLRRAWIRDSLDNGVPLALSMAHTGHVKPDVHFAYKRNARLSPAALAKLREVSTLVRGVRPELPHQTLALAGGRG